MIHQRTREEDCNAGVIFDHLESPMWPSMKFAIEAICDGLANQNIQVVLFNFPKEGQVIEEAPVAQPAEGQAPAEEVKEDIKPKDYTKEEQETYAKLVEEINNYFAEIVLRQMNHEEEKPQTAPEGGSGPADGSAVAH